MKHSIVLEWKSALYKRIVMPPTNSSGNLSNAETREVLRWTFLKSSRTIFNKERLRFSLVCASGWQSGAPESAERFLNGPVHLPKIDFFMFWIDLCLETLKLVHDLGNIFAVQSLSARTPWTIPIRFRFPALSKDTREQFLSDFFILAAISNLLWSEVMKFPPEDRFNTQNAISGLFLRCA